MDTIVRDGTILFTTFRRISDAPRYVQVNLYVEKLSGMNKRRISRSDDEDDAVGKRGVSLEWYNSFKSRIDN